MPDFNQLISVISAACGSEVKTDETTTPKTAIIEASRIVDVCTALQADPLCYFDMLSCLTGVDNGPEAGTMEVIYNLYSIPFNTHLMLRVAMPRDNPEVPSLAALYKTADWHEREAFDLFGIRFSGHPDMRRILLPADWVGHPLRKDYKHQEYYRGVKVAYEWEE